MTYLLAIHQMKREYRHFNEIAHTVSHIGIIRRKVNHFINSIINEQVFNNNNGELTGLKTIKSIH